MTDKRKISLVLADVDGTLVTEEKVLTRRAQAAVQHLREAGVDASFLLFLEYTDALKYVADHAQGKVIFMDSAAGAANRVAQAIAGMVTDPAPPAPGRVG